MPLTAAGTQWVQKYFTGTVESAMLTGAANSPALSYLINTAATDNISVVTGAAGSGLYSTPNGSQIVVDPSYFTDVTNGSLAAGTFVDGIAHELGHDVLSGGLYDFNNIMNSNYTVNYNTVNADMEQAEGTAATAEYFVSAQTGFGFWSPASVQSAAQQNVPSGVNVSTYAFNNGTLSSVQSMIMPVGVQYADIHPSNAQNLTYAQYVDDCTALAEYTGITPQSVDWSLIGPQTITFSSLGSPIITVNTIPLSVTNYVALPDNLQTNVPTLVDPAPQEGANLSNVPDSSTISESLTINTTTDAISGSGAEIYANGVTFTLASNATLGLGGSNDTINGATGSTNSQLWIYGTGDTDNVSSGTVSLEANGATLLTTGSGTVNVQGLADAIDVDGISNTKVELNGLGDSIDATDPSVDGYFQLYLNGADEIANLGAYEEANINSNYDTINFPNRNGYVEFDNSSLTATINGDWTTIYDGLENSNGGLSNPQANDFTTVDGYDNTVHGETTDQTDFIGGFFTGDTVTGGATGTDGGYGGYGYDPIVLNLSGGAVQTVSFYNSGATFDMLNNGHPVQTGWTTAGEGFLVYDPTNAAITKDSQLVDSYTALQKLDKKTTGSITPSDPLWSSLRIWEPAANGTFNPANLYTLTQLGIASIALTSTAAFQLNNGNTILRQGSFTFTNGSKGQMASVELVPNTSSPPAGAMVPVDAQLNRLISAMGTFQPPEQVSSIDRLRHEVDDHHMLAPARPA